MVCADELPCSAVLVASRLTQECNASDFDSEHACDGKGEAAAAASWSGLSMTCTSVSSGADADSDTLMDMRTALPVPSHPMH